MSIRGLTMSLQKWLSFSVALKLSFVKLLAFIRLYVLSKRDAFMWSNTTAHKSVQRYVASVKHPFQFLFCIVISGQVKMLSCHLHIVKFKSKTCLKPIIKELVWNVWIRSPVKNEKLSIMFALNISLIAR